MKMNRVYFIGITLVIVVSIGVWIQRSPKEIPRSPKEIPPVVPRSTVLPAKSDTVLTTSGKETIQGHQENSTERTQRKREMMMDFHKRLGNENEPYAQQLIRAMNSPAYEEFAKKPFSSKRWYDFLESQGVKSYRNADEKFFHRYKPGVTLDAYEVIMKQELAEMFLEAAPVDETDRAATHKHTLEVFDELTAREPANLLWKEAYFQELDEDGSGDVWFQWADNVRKNAASIVANANPSQQVSIIESIDTSAPDTTEFVEEPAINTDPEAPQRTTHTPSPEDIVTQAPQTLGDVQAKNLEQLFSESTKLLPTTDLQETLRQKFPQFPLRRLNLAIETLNQYGHEEGLRRIKESDPEVATQFERLMRPNKENH